MSKKNIRFFISLLLILAAAWQAIHVFQLSKTKQAYKLDHAELNSVKYGLMSVQEWKDKISVIFKKKVAEFKLTGRNRGEIRAKVKKMLYWLIDEVDKVMKERASKGNLLQRAGAWFVKNFALDLKGLRDRVPEFADRVMKELGNDATMKDVKGFVVKKFDEYLAKTVKEEDRSVLESLKVKYEVNNLKEGSDKLTVLEEKVDSTIKNSSIFIICCSILMFLIWYFSADKYENVLHYYLLVGICTILLSVGISTPMIDIDARIQELTLTLAGEPIQFEDQILFFQSKSIIEVVRLMLDNGKLETVLVGLLILLFSVIFPLGKLIASIFIIRKPQLLNSNKFLYFLVLKSGKWSMADVVVVAIFMSYIGFQGIISNQLFQLETVADTVDVITTNNTSLQVGFLVFTFFCIGSLFLASAVEKYARTVAT